VCTHTLRRPLANVNEQVIAWIQAALTPELVFRVVADLRAQHRQQGEKRIAALERDATKIRREIDRLVGALAVTDDKPDAIVNGIAERQARLRDLDAKISAAKAAAQVVEDTLARIVEASLDAIRRFHETVKAHPDQARDVVAALFDKIVFTPVSTPDGLRYELEGVAEIGSAHAR
jgi:septal ring factor EnvC (AmiA/AmiB activator)